MQRVRASAVCWHQEKILSVLVKDPTTGREFYILPGGEIGPEETAPEAAERETFEETGYQVRVLAETGLDTEYLFEWNGKEIECLTIFYRADLVSPFAQAVEDADYILGVKWVPRSELEQTFSYHPKIFEALLSLST